MNKLIVMVGIQGSGKSTWAKKYQEENENVVIVSSDLIRKQEPTWDNEQVFRKFYIDMNTYLAIPNTTVILDATNLTLKSRRKIFNNLKNKDFIEVEAILIATPIDICIKRVRERNKDNKSHYVPEDIVWKYAMSFQIPIENEGFDLITIETVVNNNQAYKEIWEEMKDFDQKNPNHSQTLDKHCFSVAIDLIYSDTMESEIGLLHDYGKLFTQTFDDKGVAHYYGHAEIGTYKLISEKSIIRTHILNIINYHMLPYNWKTEKAHNKWKNILGEKLYNDLLIFNKADRDAH